MNDETLRPIVQKLAQEQPQLWEAYNNLGRTAAEAGPLDARTERLVKLAIAIGANLEGAVRSHVRRARAADLSRKEIEHAALLAITTVGWPSAVAAYSWIHDEFENGE
jgi:alkylhydroperoxidase/carboxymuconolactone decarboxylase family protein YurZ